MKSFTELPRRDVIRRATTEQALMFAFKGADFNAMTLTVLDAKGRAIDGITTVTPEPGYFLFTVPAGALAGAASGDVTVLDYKIHADFEGLALLVEVGEITLYRE